VSMSWATIDKRLARLAGELAPPPAPRTAAQIAAELGMTLDPWQAEIATSPARQILLLCSRQAGKSTVAALLGLETALSVPGSLTLILSPAERQSKLLFHTLMTYYGKLVGRIPADVENRLSLELRNGSAVYALPGKEATIRGFSGVDLLIIDEGARVPDDLYMAVRPMLAVSGGRLIAPSTPFGKRGWFWQEWETGGDAWQRVKLTAYDCPRISAEWLAQERRQIPEFWFRQEYLVEFVDTIDQVFRSDDVLAAVSAQVQPLFGRTAA
jgi:hypothetical protein